METLLILKIHQEFTEMKILPDAEANPGNNQNTNQQQNTSRNITISVVDSVDSTKIASASIKENGTEIGTTGIGGGQASISNVSDGQHTLTVSATGYVTKTETITVGSDNTSFVIELVAE